MCSIAAQKNEVKIWRGPKGERVVCLENFAGECAYVQSLKTYYNVIVY